MPNFNLTVFPLVFAFLVTVIATPLSLVVLKKLNIVDDPAKHKHPAMLHTKPIPRGGGIPLFIGVLVTSIFFLPMTQVIIATLIAAFFSLLIGVIDDKYDLSPYLRFVINILCAVFVVFMGARIPFITNPLGGVLNFSHLQIPFLGGGAINLLAYAIAVLWIVWVMNMLNWSKGVDAKCRELWPFRPLLSDLKLEVFSFRSDQRNGCDSFFYCRRYVFGFFDFHFYPAKIFPGYGATAIYLVLAVASILSGAKLATAILVMECR